MQFEGKPLTLFHISAIYLLLFMNIYLFIYLLYFIMLFCNFYVGYLLTGHVLDSLE